MKELLVLRTLVRKQLKDIDVLVPSHFPSHWSTFNLGRTTVWICQDAYTSCFPGQQFPLNGLAGKRETIPAKPGGTFFDTVRGARALLDRFLVNVGVDSIIVCDYTNYVVTKSTYKLDPVLIHPGVDFKFFEESHPELIKNKYAFDKDDFIVLHVGRLVEEKRPLDSIRAISTLRDLGRIKLVLIGEGPLKEKLEAKIKALALDDNVIVTGRISEEELREWYHVGDVNLGYEPAWMMTPFEALAAGTISIVSSDCETARILKNQKIGLVVDPNPMKMAEAIRGLYERKIEYNEMVRKGKEYVKKNLTWEKYAERVLGVINYLNSPNANRRIKNER